MPLEAIKISDHIISAGSVVQLFLGITDAAQTPITGQTPTVSVRRASDGFFFSGTAFVNTSGVPTSLSMTEIGTAAPGLYSYQFTNPALLQPINNDIYQIHYINAGVPAGQVWEARAVKRALRDVNTQGV